MLRTFHLVCTRYVVRHPWRVLAAGTVATVCILLYGSVPFGALARPTSTVLLDREDRLLAATVASDGQYRFGPGDSIPARFKACLLAFEDRYFYWHPGVNPASLLHSAMVNLRAGRVVRGGSTLTMQLARMLHPGAARSYWNKFLEMVWSLRLELSFSKEDILSHYVRLAPFGGNVVGLEAASWRYYSKPSHRLSWAEAAALAVLPNAPSYIFPGRNSPEFRWKRDYVLRTVYDQGLIDSQTYVLSLQEALPRPPGNLPQVAIPLLTRAIHDGHMGQTLRTSIDRPLQLEAERVVGLFAPTLRGMQIHNSAAIIAEVRTGRILAYVGNTPGLTHLHSGYVDAANAPRSTGSILKPILHAAALDQALILPTQLLVDVPTKYGSYAPVNANRRFSGATPADRALSQSLNVPYVRLLRDYGTDFFLELLRGLGMTTFTRSADDYGLSLILGGGECSLQEIVSVYGGMARTLVRFVDSGQYFSDSYRPCTYLRGEQPAGRAIARPPLGAGAIYKTLEALLEARRPLEEEGWVNFSSTQPVAWKTGTSWGGRDAWAVGVTPRFVVGVWSGNAAGTSFAGGSGLRAAAPIMFHLFSLLPSSPGFRPPLGDLEVQTVCHASGLTPSPYCPQLDTLLIPAHGKSLPSCPYHRLVHLDQSRLHRVRAASYPLDSLRVEPWFILPPSIAFYYSRLNPYRPLPPWMEGAEDQQITDAMRFIYPRNDDTRVSIPKGMDGRPTSVIFEVAHQDSESTLFWHLDGNFVGETFHLHQMQLSPPPGIHILRVIDSHGNNQQIRFTVVYSAS